MQQIRDIIDQLGADPYDILGASPDADDQTLRKNYRSMAIKYHPDKNQDEQAKLMFLKINQAYEFLEKDENRKKYQMHRRAIEEQNKRNNAMDEKRKKFAEQLKRNQEEHRRTQTQIEKELQKKKQFFRKKMEEQQERQNIKKEVFDSIGTQKYYEMVSSFDVFWKEGLNFTQGMLRIAFQAFGNISGINLEPKRNRATVIFNSIEDCTKIVQKFNHPMVTVRFHLQKSKREHLLKALNRQKSEKIDLSLSSENIERFKQIINRGSGIYRETYREQF